jgi:hypothetical protein
MSESNKNINLYAIFDEKGMLFGSALLEENDWLPEGYTKYIIPQYFLSKNKVQTYDDFVSCMNANNDLEIL